MRWVRTAGLVAACTLAPVPVYASAASEGGAAVPQVAMALVLLLTAAKLRGDLAVRIGGQPAVLGELVIGVLHRAGQGTRGARMKLDATTITAAAVFAGSLLLGIAVSRLAFRRLAALAQRTDSQLDDAFVAALRRPLPFWFALAGAWGASRMVELPARLTAAIDPLLAALLIASLTFWGAGLSVRALAIALQRPASGAVAPPGALQNVVRIAVLGIGALVLLNTLGVSIAPVLTTVGIGGVAVALGLQDTLSNLFAGVHITLAGNLRVGDFVRLESGEEGYVEDIRWRSTSVRTLPNNRVLIPNSRLAQSVVTNYYLPAKEMAVLVEVGVHYASDLERVERVTCEVAREVLATTDGGVRDFEPFIRFHGFGASSIDFTVVLRAREFTDGYLLKHRFVMALARRFANEGIVIPFPIRALNLEQESAGERLARLRVAAPGS